MFQSGSIIREFAHSTSSSMLDKTQKIVETRYEENMTTTALVRIIG